MIEETSILNRQDRANQYVRNVSKTQNFTFATLCGKIVRQNLRLQFKRFKCTPITAEFGDLIGVKYHANDFRLRSARAARPDLDRRILDRKTATPHAARC